MISQSTKEFFGSLIFPSKRVALRRHGADRYEEDMQRQRQLERCGWEFFRVRESAFYADKDAALLDLWLMLEERGILPGANLINPCIDNNKKNQAFENLDSDETDNESEF